MAWIHLKVGLDFFAIHKNKQILTTPTKLSDLCLNKVERKFVFIIIFVSCKNVRTSIFFSCR